MTILEPDSLHIDLRFIYRDCKVELDRRSEDGHTVYVVWVHYSKGCAIATTDAPTKTAAVRRAKAWIDGQFFGNG
ncbi:MAG: hypothetical protein AAGB01_11120 [Cyanobacteria bacterium P01_F01_bin.42]